MRACLGCTPAPSIPCACLACSVHPESACAASVLATLPGGFCDACAPSWQCECVLQSCWHHRNTPRCTVCIPWDAHRLLAPGRSKNVCSKCSPQYCCCASATCLAHAGRGCARCRQHGGEGFCLSCSRGGALACLCAGCAACSATPCRSAADFSSEAAGEIAVCLPCAGQALKDFAKQRSLQLGIAASSDEALLHLLCSESSAATLGGERALKIGRASCRERV